MARYNKNFQLSLSDMEVIETALRAAQRDGTQTPFDAKAISAVLGNLHNQKTFFRPKDGVYISG